LSRRPARGAGRHKICAQKNFRKLNTKNQIEKHQKTTYFDKFLIVNRNFFTENSFLPKTFLVFMKNIRTKCDL